MIHLLTSRIRSRVGQWTGPFWVAAIALALPAACRAPEPVEKRVQELVRLLGSETFEEREKAVQELIKVGAPALEPLRKASASTDAEVARLAKVCIPKIEHNVKVAGFLRQLRSDKQEDRLAGARGLCEMEKRVGEIVPALAELLDDPRIDVREATACVLYWAGPNAETALPKLLPILADNSPGTTALRWRVIIVLEEMGPPGRKGAPILLRILETEGPEMMHYAAHGLAILGQDEPGVGPALLKALSHEDICVKDSAAAALACLRKESEKTVPAIISILKTYPFRTSRDLETKCAFARHLGRYGPLAEQAVPYLIGVCKDDEVDDGLRLAAKEALIDIGAPAHKAIPGLKELGKHPSDRKFYELIDKLDRK
jgi:HEAT repeat protein